MELASLTSAQVKMIGRKGGVVANAMGTTIFSFYPKVTLTKLHPLGGPEIGGTAVEIQGTNFVQTGLKCLFNGIESPSTQWISPSRIVCEAPEATFRSLHASQVNVTVAINEADKLNSNDLHFVYLPASHIASFNPVFGSVEGGTLIHIRGSGFERIEGVLPQCLFSSSNISTVASVLSRNLIKCPIPPAHLANTTTVAVSFNGGADAVSVDRVFTYISPATIDSASPNYISCSGGTKVTISGNNFIPDMSLGEASYICSFGGTVVAATAITTDTMVCFAPPMAPGSVEVRVTVNGVDFTDHAANVIYHLPTEIYGAIPPFATKNGGETITVIGTNFQPSIDLSCIFSSSPENVQITAAMFGSESQVTCTVPPSDVGLVASSIEISNSKETNPGNPTFPFQYYPLISILAAKPCTGLSGESELVLDATGFHSSQVAIHSSLSRISAISSPIESYKIHS